MRKLLLLFSLTFISCDGNVRLEEPTVDCDIIEDLGVSLDTEIDLEWLCWNPESEHHLGPCREECTVPGDQTKYCFEPEG